MGTKAEFVSGVAVDEIAPKCSWAGTLQPLRLEGREQGRGCRGGWEVGEVPSLPKEACAWELIRVLHKTIRSNVDREKRGGFLPKTQFLFPSLALSFFCWA